MNRTLEVLYQLAGSASVCYKEELPPSTMFFFDDAKCKLLVETAYEEIRLIHEATIESLRAEVERLKKPAYEYECPSCKTIMSPHSRKFLRNELSRLRSALKKIVRNWPCDNNECGRIAKQALSKTWEDGG